MSDSHVMSLQEQGKEDKRTQKQQFTKVPNCGSWTHSFMTPCWIVPQGGWHPVLSSCSNPRLLFCMEEGISGMYLGSKQTEDANSKNYL